MSADAVEAYHQLFFEVRPHMAARDRIMARAVGATGACFAGLPLGAIWKLFAVAGGPIALDAVVAATTDAPLADLLRDACGGATNYTERLTRLQLRLFIALLCATSAEELMPLIELRSGLRRLDRRCGEPDEEERGLLPAIELFLRKCVGRKKQAQRRDAVQTTANARVIDVGEPTRGVPASASTRPEA
ncbi:MAG TPA: hypothetical protein VMS17_29205 [Gemmataceae bacterium]|nr:hypothetical protein [Gemmataceae bacterium]